MYPLTVTEIVRAVNGILIIGDPKQAIGSDSSAEDNCGVCESHLREKSKSWHSSGISIDSRTVARGEVFFAIVGEQFDGHAFFSEVIQKGAAACVVSRLPGTLNVYLSHFPAIIKVRDTKKALADCAGFYRRKYGTNLKVAGISGSCGKTTVKEMLAQILKRVGPAVYTPGNYNNDVGCPLSVFSLTPKHEFGIFEIGSSSLGEVNRLSAVVAPRIAVITNIKLEHTATFGSLQNIAEGETEILSNLSENGWAILPFDDPFYEFMKAKVPKTCKVKSFGFSDKASVHVSKFPSWNGTGKVTLTHQDESGKVLDEIECAIPVLGRFNLLNACASAAAALCMGVSSKIIRDALENFLPPQMRFQSVKLNNGIVFINDSYNANPGSMRAALEGFVESFPEKKKCLVLGDMLELGEIAREEHYSLGQFIAKLPISKLILYGPQSQFVAEGAKDSFLDAKTVFHCTDKNALIHEIQAQMAHETAFLFKASRGMRLEETIEKLTLSANHSA